MIYWIHALKKFDRGAYVPTYEVVETEPPQGEKKEALPPDHCIDVFKTSLSTDGTYILVELYTVYNVNGAIEEKLTENFLIERAG